MKKRFVLFLLCLLLCIGGGVSAGAGIYSQRDTVEITETVLYGDKSVVNGLRFTAHATYASQLYWDTTYTIGDNAQTETSFQYLPAGRSYDYLYDDRGVYVSVFGSVGISGSIDLETEYLYGYEQAVRDMAARMQNGETRTEALDMRDYYDYYPLYFDLEFDSEPDTYDLLRQQFNDFFKLPMAAAFPVKITLHKAEDGSIDEFNVEEQLDWDASSPPQFVNAAGDNACYFTFYTAYQAALDYSEIPGGLGIYCLPLSTQDGKTTAHGEQLANIYPLDEDTKVEGLQLSSDGQQLFLLTEEDGAYWLTVLDTETNTPVQKLSLIDLEGDTLERRFFYDDFHVYVLYDGRFAVVERQDNGQWRCALRSSLPSDEEMGEIPGYESDYTDVWKYRLLFSAYGQSAMDWDGSRLTIAAFDQNDWGTPYFCSFYLSTYDESGILFCARYDSSLNTLTDSKPCALTDQALELARTQ